MKTKLKIHFQSHSYPDIVPNVSETSCLTYTRNDNAIRGAKYYGLFVIIAHTPPKLSTSV